MAKQLAQSHIALQIYEINRETQEEKLREQYDLDISPLLFPKSDPVSLSWTFHMLKPQQIHSLSVSISSDKPLLSEFLRKKLNPLQVNLVACKDIPYKTHHKFKPIYSVFKFVNGQHFRTLELPQ